MFCFNHISAFYTKTKSWKILTNNKFKAKSLNRKSYWKFKLSWFSVTCFKHVGLLWPISALDRKQVRGYLMIASGLFRMLGASCDVCNNRLFLHSFNNLNLIFIYHPIVISRNVLCETTSVAVNGGICKFCLYAPCVHFGFFLTPSVVDIQLLP